MNIAMFGCPSCSKSSLGDAANASYTPVEAAALIAKVDADYAAALVYVGLIQGGNLDLVISQLTSGTFIDYDMNAAAWATSNLIQSTKWLNLWNTTFLAWAYNGKRDDGTAYSWGEWADFGYTLISQANTQANISYDYSYLNSLIATIKQTYKDIATPSSWPIWAKLLLAGGVVYGLNDLVFKAAIGYKTTKDAVRAAKA